MEIWKEIDGYDGRYHVSSLGRVYSNYGKGRYLSIYKDKKGYGRVCLNMKGGNTVYAVHTLVAKAFIGGNFDGLEVNHIDFDRSNNNLINIELVTRQENIKHSIDNITNAQAKYYLVTFPCNTEKVVYNLNKFCREYGLNSSGMHAVIRGRCTHYKGYKVKHI